MCDEFNKEYNEKYRKLIIQTILKDNNLINSNNLLIKTIFSENLYSELEDMERAFDIISNEDIFFSLFNNSKEKNVEEIIMKIFDSIINICFDSYSLSEFAKLLVSDLFDDFKNYIDLLNENKYSKYFNENICKLFAICYIKIYLKRFVYYLYQKTNFLEGNEKQIIQEIYKDYKISNTIKIYLIILLYNEIKSIDKLKDYILNENYFLELSSFINNLKTEIGEDNFNKIINNSSILREGLLNIEKYPFCEYFIYTEYPTFENFKNKLFSINNYNDKYPLIEQYIKNESGAKNLKYLKSYNDFVNLMINTYSGKISRNSAENKLVLNREEIYNEDIFKKRFEDFKTIWNEHLYQECGKNARKLADFDNLAYFLNDNNESGYGIYISNGYHKFIKWQNDFLKPIINSYKNKRNNILSCYISKIEKKINIQSASNLQILQIEKCFENSCFKNFNDLIYIYSNRNLINYNEFIYDFQKIEEELGKLILPGKCLFDENNLNYVIYQLEGFRLINYDFLINYGKKYFEEKLNIEEKKKILIYTNKEYMYFKFIYDSFIVLVNYLNNNFCAEKNKKINEIIEIIEKTNKNNHINFSAQFIKFFKDEGKDISVEKLLSSILFMEQLCYNNLIENIEPRFKQSLEDKENEIRNFIENNTDNIITKNEIAAAIRRYITRFLIIDNQKENIDETSNLFMNLERKYLWNNKIFSKIDDNKFKEKLKKFINNCPFLQVKHSIKFYELIGTNEREELNKFIRENETKKDEKLMFNNSNNSVKNKNNKNKRNIKGARFK